MPLVLFNTGWMKHYRGLTPSDQVFNGGSYVEENETGSEIRNFEPLQGRCYGYASPRGGRKSYEPSGRSARRAVCE